MELITKAHEMIGRLLKVRGAAHDVIIGEWARWWIELDPENHLVLNPSPFAETHGADIMFLEPEYEEAGGERQPYLWMLSGVAEVENRREKWFEKLESLKENAQKYPLKFVLLCVRVYLNTLTEIESFKQLVEKTVELSKDIPNVSWILYRLNQSPWKEDVNPIVFSRDPEARVWWYRFISDGEAIIVKDGKIE